MALSVSFFSRPTLEVLEDLMGMILVRISEEGVTSGVIVEAEAYRGEDDPASFAFKGRKRRSEMLYHSPGYAFVYLTYGIHHMLNVITEEENFPAAVLIRAVEPLAGIPLMRERRHSESLEDLCSGPAKICQAFAIDTSLNGVPLFSRRSPLYIKERRIRKRGLVWSSRIGIRQGKEKLWRVFLKDSPFVSVRNLP
ncbi:MAG: DNA-3-methyladenine glycosylase [Candidatus Aminicenantales bacterium]